MARKAECATFSQQDIESLRPAMKIGLLATVNSQGLPHITLLSSLQAASPTGLTFGQFIEGLGKSNVTKNPRVGFLIMTLQREMWRGRALFRETTRSGPEFEEYNRVPMFRYNAYTGIHTVFRFDLVRHGGRERLPMASIVCASLATKVASLFTLSRQPCRALTGETRRLMEGMGNLKFAAWVDTEGFPRIVPVIQAQPLGDRIIFSTLAFTRELAEIPPGVPLAVFGMSLNMEDVLARGLYLGARRIGCLRCAVAEIDWVYNPMPPVPGQIYPSAELAPVTDFEAAAPQSSP
ncbi:MAG: hypothetical protein ABSG38_08665 [Spirochaetia bacterium]|jgi:hypothetical protein